MCYKGAARQEPFFILNYLSQSPLCILRFLLLLFILWFLNALGGFHHPGPAPRKHKMLQPGMEDDPQLGKGPGPRWSQRNLLLKQERLGLPTWVSEAQGDTVLGGTVLTPTAAELRLHVVQRKTPETRQISPELFPPSSYIPSLLRINVLVFCQPPFQPKGIPTHSHHYTGEIISSALKKKNKPTVKSQQKETTSVGCKMTKRKANECPGRGPAIAEKCNLERGIRGAFAAKHMSRAVPETVCLFFSRSQLKKAVRALQAVFQFWPRDFAKQRDYSICMKIVLEAVRKNCSNEILICRCIYSWNTACK